jgi:protein SHQ1
LRLQKEAQDFDPDRYLGDMDIGDDCLYQCAMSMVPHWRITMKQVDEMTLQLAELTTSIERTAEAIPQPSTSSLSYFTSEESALLASISYPILDDNLHDKHPELLLGLLDLLFAYIYDHLLTQGEPTIKSSWMVYTLSTLLSWLDTSISMEITGMI